jgi:hypothetical protein
LDLVLDLVLLMLVEDVSRGGAERGRGGRAGERKRRS